MLLYSLRNVYIIQIANLRKYSTRLGTRRKQLFASTSSLNRCKKQSVRHYAQQESNKEERKGSIFEWKGIVTRFLPIGICLVAVMQWRAYRKHSKERIATKAEVDFYTVLPLKQLSRIWGVIANINQPEFLRPFIYGLYINLFGVNLNEAENADLKSYRTLSDFFVRKLRNDLRPIDVSSELVSPCDGTVLHIAPVVNGRVEQVKGITYFIEQFLGDNIWAANDHTDYHASLKQMPHYNTSLYQCVIYLAPGDYHRFHSPTDWNLICRRHFPGELLSVNPIIAKFIPGLFVLNERAVYVGTWKYGFFSYSAVGATNVGSVRVYFDKALETNNPKIKSTNHKFMTDISLTKGEMIGEFRMGSTIVLLFEAPNDFQFNIKCGEKVRMGEAIGCAAAAVKAVKK